MDAPEGSQRTLFRAVVALVIVLGAVFFAFQYFGARREEVPTLEETRKALLSRATITFPNVQQSSVISLKQVPGEVRFLVFENAVSPVIQSVLYQNGDRGYQAHYTLNASLDAAYIDFRRLVKSSPGWEEIFGSRASQFAFLEAENSAYQARVSQTFINTEKHKVFIEIISKRK